MKNILMIFFSLAVFLSVIFFSGCKKRDSTAPSLYLTSSSQITQSLPTSAGSAIWTEPGYRASDDEDGDITSRVTVTGSVNPNFKGTYVLTYAVSDDAGNAAPRLSRTVHIVNDAEVFAGAYNNSVDTCVAPPDTSQFNAAVFTSDTINNLVKIQNFGAFDSTGTYLVYATLTGSSVTVPISPTQFVDTMVYLEIFYPTESAIISAVTPTQFKIKYKWNDGTLSSICTSYYIR